MPKVSPVKILKEEVVERQSQPVMMGETQSDHDTDSEVDINYQKSELLSLVSVTSVVRLEGAEVDIRWNFSCKVHIF